MFQSTTRNQEEIKSSTDRAFGLVFAAVFLLIAIWPLVFGGELRIWAAYVASAFLVLSLVLPVVLSPLNKAWTKFGLLLHHIMTPLVMGAVFFGIVTPMAGLMRLFGKRPLDMKYSKDATYWIKREPPGPAPESFKNQF